MRPMACLLLRIKHTKSFTIQYGSCFLWLVARRLSLPPPQWVKNILHSRRRKATRPTTRWPRDVAVNRNNGHLYGKTPTNCFSLRWQKQTFTYLSFPPCCSHPLQRQQPRNCMGEQMKLCQHITLLERTTCNNNDDWKWSNFLCWVTITFDKLYSLDFEKWLMSSTWLWLKGNELLTCITVWHLPWRLNIQVLISHFLLFVLSLKISVAIR